MIYKFDPIYFLISETVFEIFRKKTVFERSFSDATVS